MEIHLRSIICFCLAGDGVTDVTSKCPSLVRASLKPYSLEILNSSFCPGTHEPIQRHISHTVCRIKNITSYNRKWIYKFILILVSYMLSRNREWKEDGRKEGEKEGEWQDGRVVERTEVRDEQEGNKGLKGKKFGKGWEGKGFEMERKVQEMWGWTFSHCQWCTVC